jgi:hypothetical protein
MGESQQRRGPGYRARVPDACHHRKAGKVVIIPLAPRTARVIDLAGTRPWWVAKSQKSAVLSLTSGTW